VSIDNIARIARGLRVERGGCSGTTEPGAPIRFRARRPLSKQVPPWRSEKLAARFDPKLTFRGVHWTWVVALDFRCP
jgi:hypothetical protein